MTQEQAIKLWYNAIHEEPICEAYDKQLITKVSLFTNTLNFLGVRYHFDTDWNIESGRMYSKQSLENVASFLREWADALENKQTQ